MSRDYVRIHLEKVVPLKWRSILHHFRAITTWWRCKVNDGKILRMITALYLRFMDISTQQQIKPTINLYYDGNKPIFRQNQVMHIQTRTNASRENQRNFPVVYLVRRLPSFPSRTFLPIAFYYKQFHKYQSSRVLKGSLQSSNDSRMGVNSWRPQPKFPWSLTPDWHYIKHGHWLIFPISCHSFQLGRLQPQETVILIEAFLFTRNRLFSLQAHTSLDCPSFRVTPSWSYAGRPISSHSLKVTNPWKVFLEFRFDLSLGAFPKVHS